MEKIKIFVTNIDGAGVGKHRMLGPYSYLQKMYPNEFTVDIESTSDFSDLSRYKDYHFIVCHRSLTQDYSKHSDLVKELNKIGVKVIVDIDDYWMVPHHHGLYHMVKQNKIDKMITDNIRSSNFVTTTTSIFADKIRGYNKNVVVFANAINPNEKQFQPKKTNSNLVRVGWIGGSSHSEDIQLLNGWVNKLTGDNTIKKIQTVLCGFDLRGSKTILDQETGEQKSIPITPEETVWVNTYEKTFTDNYKTLSPEYRNYLLKYTKEIKFDDCNEHYSRRWTLPVNSYAEHYNHIDISLAPLKSDTGFNLVKSQLKVIESGFFKKPIIASDFGPYKIDIKDGKNGFLVSENKNHKDWVKNIKKMVESPALMEDIGNSLYETVKDKYSMETVTKERRDFFMLILEMAEV